MTDRQLLAFYGLKYNPFLPKYDTDDYFPLIAPGGSTAVTVAEVPGGAAASPSQKGILFLYRVTKASQQADVVNVSP